ncbi:MAG TPA: hypothetical protein VM802_32135 [Chitinophaga sp.]|uniref:hypothetical protein n=1 Tax=Chitinophaga sp. TaxID=1869181 RepID=UPI002BB5E1A6|nr:hypothetical protein [Chitinophaga sp.]HVI49561.1 hypothetical protein [Chitinophaga sp.]
MKYIGLAGLFLLLACHTSQRIYTAPAMGAESQFDRGLRPEKHPKYLFDKKTMRDMQRQGTASGYSGKRRSNAPTAPVSNKSGAAAADSSSIRPDSIRHNIPDSLHTPPLPDSARMPR